MLLFVEFKILSEVLQLISQCCNKSTIITSTKNI